VNADMPLGEGSDWPLACHRCGAALTRGEGSLYIVRIEAMADPTPPALDRESTMEDLAVEWEELLARMENLSAQELMDQVYRRMILLLCAPCYRTWIDNPTG
jgi:hypothetical protein